MEGYNHVAVWENVNLNRVTVKQFEDWFSNSLGLNIKYIETVKTAPIKRTNDPGGREDILFYVHDDSCVVFRTVAETYGFKWFSQVVRGRYDKEIMDKYKDKGDIVL